MHSDTAAARDAEPLGAPSASRKRTIPGTVALRVLGYLRVSTAEQASSGAGLDAQRAAIGGEAERRGWSVAWLEDAGCSARDLRRPGIQEALRRLHDGEADALVIAKLDRLSRSLLDFAAVTAQAQREGWKVVALDLGVDTSTPSGEMLANVLASFAQFERRLIGQRTAEALRAKRAAGVRLGRPPMLPDHVRIWIVNARQGGATYLTIADALNRDGVPTAHGAAQWRPSTVAWALRAG